MTTVADVLAIGLDHHRDGRLDSAEHAYRAVLTFDAGQIDAVRLMGSLLYEQNRHEEAAALLGQSVTAGAINAEICRIWACALAAVGLGGEVVAAGWRVLALDPTDAHTGHLVAHFLRESGRSELARAMLTQAILLQPDLAVAHHDIGVIDRVAGQYRLAAESFQRAVGHDPGLDSGWYNLGCTKLQLGDVDAGIAALRRVVEAETASAALTASALVEIGKAQFGNGDVAAALASYRLAIDRDANNAEAAFMRVQTYYLTDDCRPDDYLVQRRQWAERFAPVVNRPRSSYGNDTNLGRRLRIGYVGAHHLVGNTNGLALLPTIEAHDHELAEVFIYSDVVSARTDAYTTRYREAADRWIDTSRLDDAGLATQIHDDQIDVLVDVFGHVTGARFAVFGARAAPVQVALTVTGTSGHRAIDALVVDRILLPPESVDQICERPAYVPLAYTYRPIFEPPELRPLPAALRGYVTFGSFNQLAKLSNLCLTTWARILVAVPGSRLIIKGQGLRNSEVRNRYLDTFGRHGVAADRLDLRPPTSGFIEHLDAFGECDVMLDSFPYNGVTTTCESLMMGLPVVTLLGDRIAGRYGASLLTAVGRADEIAMDVDDYVARAMRLAGDMNRLIELRQTLRGMLAASALYRPRHFAEHLEAAYRNLWRNWCDGDRP